VTGQKPHVPPSSLYAAIKAGQIHTTAGCRRPTVVACAIDSRLLITGAHCRWHVAYWPPRHWPPPQQQQQQQQTEFVSMTLQSARGGNAARRRQVRPITGPVWCLWLWVRVSRSKSSDVKLCVRSTNDDSISWPTLDRYPLAGDVIILLPHTADTAVFHPQLSTTCRSQCLWQPQIWCLIESPVMLLVLKVLHTLRF